MACRNVCHGNTEDNGTGKYCNNVVERGESEWKHMK